jgi:hypothetical protein
MPKRLRDDEPDDDWEDTGRTERRRRRKEDRKKRTLYILIAASAVFLVTCGGVVTFVVVQTRRAVKEFQQVMKPFETGPPVARVSADDLVRAYEQNADAAFEKYTGESVQVDGIVASVSKQPDGSYLVTLQTGNSARVHAEFDIGRGADARKLQPGLKCSIIGICDGVLDDFDNFPPKPRRGGDLIVMISFCRLAE